MTDPFISYRGVTLDMNGERFRTAGRAGFSVARDGLDDFSSGIEWSGEDVARPGGHGSFGLPAFMSAKARAVSAIALADSAHGLVRLRDEALGLGRGGGFDELVWHDGVVRRVCVAQVRSVTGWRPRRSQRAREHAATVLFQWWCPDPWWHGETREWTIPAGGRVLVETLGTEATWPVVTVTGPVLPGWGLEAAGRRVTVNVGIPSGGSCVVDMETGSVVDHRGLELQEAVVGAPWPVEPGAPLEVRFTGSGGSALVRVTDRFI